MKLIENGSSEDTHTHTITLEVFPFKEKAVAFWQSQEF